MWLALTSEMTVGCWCQLLHWRGEDVSPLETHSCGLLPAPESGGWPDVAAEGPCFSGESAYSLIIFSVLYI